MNTRTLGTLCIVGSLIWGLDALRWMVIGLDEFDTLGMIANAIWGAGGACAIVGMIRLNAVGANAIVRALAFVPIIGFLLLIVGNIMQLAGLVTTDTNMAAGLAWLLQLVGTLLVAILAIAARNWQGWRRFVPLLCIVLVPVGFGLDAALGRNGVGTALLALTWMLLGYVVATAEPVADLRPAHA